MFGAVKLTKNAGHDKYSYSGCGIGLDSRSVLLFQGFDWGKIIVSFGVDNSSSVYIDNKTTIY